MCRTGKESESTRGSISPMNLDNRLTNAQLVDLLAKKQKKSTGILARAYRRAVRNAFLWP